MELKDYVKKIKNYITGFGVLQSELDDKMYSQIVNDTVREINNYYNVSELLEVEGSRCIDLTNYPQINDVVGVHRTDAVGQTQGYNSATISDPSYMSFMQMYSPYAMNPDQMYKMTVYTTAQKLANTYSTDLSFYVDQRNKKLYINYSQGIPTKIVIEYIPKLNDASDVLTQHWQDFLYRLALADAKAAIGRIRTRYVQNDALFTDDGDRILEEGIAEGEAIRAQLKANADLVLPLD